MKNYKIIFKGEVIQTIKASTFSRSELGQTLFLDKDKKLFCIIPKEYMVLETDFSTREEALLDQLIDWLNAPVFNDIDRRLPNFEELKAFHESKNNQLIEALNNLKSNLKR